MRAPDRLLLVAAPAAVLASVDLVVKAHGADGVVGLPPPLAGWVVLSIAVLFGAFSLTLVRSRVVAVAAGVMCGGVIGNLVSARSDENWVPNPLVIGDYERGIAFNLADVFFLVGNLLLMSALIVMSCADAIDLPRRARGSAHSSGSCTSTVDELTQAAPRRTRTTPFGVELGRERRSTRHLRHRSVFSRSRTARVQNDSGGGLADACSPKASRHLSCGAALNEAALREHGHDLETPGA